MTISAMAQDQLPVDYILEHSSLTADDLKENTPNLYYLHRNTKTDGDLQNSLNEYEQWHIDNPDEVAYINANVDMQPYIDKNKAASKGKSPMSAGHAGKASKGELPEFIGNKGDMSDEEYAAKKKQWIKENPDAYNAVTSETSEKLEKASMKKKKELQKNSSNE